MITTHDTDIPDLEFFYPSFHRTNLALNYVGAVPNYKEQNQATALFMHPVIRKVLKIGIWEVPPAGGSLLQLLTVETAYKVAICPKGNLLYMRIYLIAPRYAGQFMKSLN